LQLRKFVLKSESLKLGIEGTLTVLFKWPICIKILSSFIINSFCSCILLVRWGFYFVAGQKMIPQKTAETLTSDEVPLWGKKIREVYDVNER
jgi:hypothetical protein